MASVASTRGSDAFSPHTLHFPDHSAWAFSSLCCWPFPAFPCGFLVAAPFFGLLAAYILSPFSSPFSVLSRVKASIREGPGQFCLTFMHCLLLAHCLPLYIA
ncbi:unnamed protein product, partial [Chrysoparadoxa australica]